MRRPYGKILCDTGSEANYQQAAWLKNPTGLVNAGLILTGVDRRVWKLPARDEKKGREYLEEARRL